MLKTYSPLVAMLLLSLVIFSCGRENSNVEATPDSATALMDISEKEIQNKTIITETETLSDSSPVKSVPTDVQKDMPRENVTPKLEKPAATFLSEQDEEMTTVQVVKILKPSVVQILTGRIVPGAFAQATPRSGVGSGIVLDKDGHILTNNHVVKSANEISATLSDGRTYKASVVGTDPRTDLAVVKISAAKLIPARIGESSELQVGEEVIAVGHALGLKGGPTVSKGVISALERTIDVDPQTSMVDLIQTDASINPGNSGGPLANSGGEVIGVNTAIIKGSNGIGFAINIDDAQIVVSQLIEFGKVSRGFLGISPFNVTDSLVKQLQLPVSTGIIVARVIDGFPAKKAGMRVEDVIVMMNQQEIQNNGDLSKFLIEHLPGKSVEIKFYRNGKLMTREIVLSESP